MYIDKIGLAYYKNGSFILDEIEKVMSLLDMSEIVSKITFSSRMDNRAMYDYRQRRVIMNPRAKCFQLDYKGYQYKTFGGIKDLTPAGVLCHECGHGVTFLNPVLLKRFRTIRIFKPKSITRYGSSSVGEDIAECFRLYVSNPSLLVEVDEDRYNTLHAIAHKYILIRR